MHLSRGCKYAKLLSPCGLISYLRIHLDEKEQVNITDTKCSPNGSDQCRVDHVAWPPVLPRRQVQHSLVHE